MPVHQVCARHDTLKLSLSALSNQSISRSQFEVIIVDNSSDEAHQLKSIVGSFQNLIQIKCFREKKPSSYRARNRGVVESTGRILAFLDSDCIADPTWLEEGLNFFERDGSEFIIAGKIRRISKSRTGNLIERHEKLFTLNQRRNVLSNNFGATANLMCTRNLFFKVGPFRSDLLSGGDVEWCHRAQLKGAKLIYTPRVVIYHQLVSSLGDLLKRYRRKAGGTYKLKKENLFYINTKPYRGFNPSAFLTRKLFFHPIRIMHISILIIQKLEGLFCFFGKKPIHG